MRNLTLEGRIVVFETLAKSKIVFLALLTKILHQVVKELEMKQPLKSTVFLEGYDNNFHEWKLIPLHLITMSFGSKFKFHSNVIFKTSSLKNFYRSTEIFLLIGRHIFLQVLKPQLAFFRNFYGLTSIFK